MRCDVVCFAGGQSDADYEMLAVGAFELLNRIFCSTDASFSHFGNSF
jgi:hypothetical protein